MTTIKSMISTRRILLILIALLFLILIVFVVDGASLHRETAAEVDGSFSVSSVFSHCLPVVSLPPNVTGEVSPKCCDAITFLFNHTGISEPPICHLLRDPQSFGVPLNISGVLSLSSVCLGNTKHSLECPSVEFSGEFVSAFEDAIRKCDLVIHASCVGEQKQCCRNLCEKHRPRGKTIDVSYKVINGSLVCFCHIIYPDKPDSCAIMLNF